MIVLSRVTAPSTGERHITRVRLRDLPHVHAEARIGLIQAPAGYGKSILLAQWHDDLKAKGADVAWLTLDSSNDTADAFLTYVEAMLAGRQPAEAAGQGAPIKRRITAICAALEARPTAALFFDDIDKLQPDAMQALGQLMEWAPKTVRFFIAARCRPKFPYARLRAHGQLFEVGVADLAFSAQDIAGLDEARELSSDVVNDLLALTGGWVAGVKLAASSARQKEDASFALEAFTGARAAVADFFDEEVFSRSSPEQRMFLLETSILDRFCGPLCDAVTQRKGGREMLLALEEAGLFIFADDVERVWFRHHPLFRDFLRKKLGDERAKAESELHMRASAWAAEEGLYDLALMHGAKSGDVAWQSGLLERWCEDLLYKGKVRILDKYAAQLPTAVLDTCPRLLLAVAWFRTRQGRFDEAMYLVRKARAAIDQRKAEDGLSATDEQDLEAVYRHREMMLDAATDQASIVEEKCNALIREFADRNLNIQATLYAQLISARRHQMKYNGLNQLEGTARTILERCGHQPINVPLYVEIGLSAFERGHNLLAERAFEEGIAEGHLFTEVRAGLPALAALPLAELLYERNDCERARALVDEYLPYVNEIGFTDNFISGYAVRARLRMAAGDAEGAIESLDEAMNPALERGLHRLQLTILAEKIRILLRDGQLERASECGQYASIPVSHEPLLPHAGSTAEDEVKAAAWVRLAIAHHHTADALTLANKWVAFCTQRGALRALVKWNLLLTHILVTMGSVKPAQRALRDALSRAAPGRFVRSFIDESPVVGELLSESYSAGVSTDDYLDRFAKEILDVLHMKASAPEARDAPEDADAGATLNRLSWREAKILKLVASGMQNKEIGNRLGLTEGTVKWYMQQIYDKIGVRRRSQAVERARRMGLV